ncbi:alkaline phosphatase [Arthrobacter sp. 35/47]|uniref:alkaline phosphatase n=1 Tax=Arthrobacter sp. 35/47 TaxID=269454 RepID=UPI000479B301|nr:alkaline phosphatase [Arthrobacter sp. 35/47]
MKSKQIRRPLYVGGAAVLAASAVTAGMVLPATAGLSDGQQADTGQDKARNVILLVGDGMGDFELSAARNYQYGADGRLKMDAMPDRSTVTTYSVQESDPAAPNYVADSAATSTAWSTGVKTSNGRISTIAGADEDVPTSMEMAQEAGMLIGNVSTARLTDATPAGAMAHVAKRGCEGPVQTTKDCPQDATENDGPGSIAEQSIDLGVDVLLGGGADRYDQKIIAGEFAGQTVTDSAAARGYNVVRDADNLDGAQLPVLGLFSGGHLPTELTGAQAAPGGVDVTCEANPEFTEEIPTVDEMTDQALDMLDRTQGNNGAAKGQPGFFLQVEGASIDKQDHAANPCAQIGETVAFDRAVQVALDYAEAEGNTTVLVTADHSHTSQIIPADDTDSPGATATLTTSDGQPMKLNYATSPTTKSQDHTGSTVPLLGFGPGAEDLPALIDQTDIFGIITTALNLR